MSRFLSVLSASFLGFCIAAPLALGVDYHVQNVSPLPPDTPTNVYFATLATVSSTPLLPGGTRVLDVNARDLVFHNNDATTSALSGPLDIAPGANVTVQSDGWSVYNISATNSPIFRLDNSSYFATPTLKVLEEIRFDGSRNNGSYGVIVNGTATSAAGVNLREEQGVPFVIPNTVGSNLDVSAVSFTNNQSTSNLSRGGAIYSVGKFKADTGTSPAYNTAVDAVFTGNKAGSGAAIYLDQWSVLNAEGAKFTQNVAGVNGGAIASNLSYIYAEDVMFDHNQAAAGGAVHATNSAVFLKGSDFQSNTATGEGGAIRFTIDDGFNYALQLGTTYDSVAFSGNTDSSGLNSIVFSGGTSTTAGTALVNIDVEGNSSLNMDDPMRIGSSATIGVSITKTGLGTWKLSGFNDLGRASLGTKIDVMEGTLLLADGVNLDLLQGKALDAMYLRPEGTIFVGDDGETTAQALVRASTVNFEAGGRMVLNGTLELELVGSNSLIASTILGDGNLVKSGSGTLEISGTNKYTGTTSVEQGTLLLTNADAAGIGTSAINVAQSAVLALDLKNGTKTSFTRQIDGKGKVVKQGDSTVKLTNTANSYEGGTEIRAGILQFDDTNVFGNGALSFTGGTLQNTTGGITLSQSVNAVKGQFARFDTQVNRDLIVAGGISGDGGLVKTGSATLTLTGGNSYLGETWLNEGTVEIAARNNIGTGKIVFNGGQFRNLGVDVTLDNNVQLEIGKNGIVEGAAGSNLTLAGTITGCGMLVKNGDATSTLTRTGTNTYSGGTQINSGTVAFSRKESLGIATITFNGGTLHNTETVSGLKQNILINSGVQAKFDVDAEHDLGIDSAIGGNGGMTKLGNGLLTLNGVNTYTGDTIVSAGELAIDGAVNSRVQVERNAILSGSGTVRRDVRFLNGSIYQWDFHASEDQSPYLHVNENVYLENATFKPITYGVAESYGNADGWTVLSYGGRLLGDGYFAVVDDSACPFMDITMNYDTPGQVRIVATNRYEPRAMSDSMATGLVMAQRRMYVKPFEQIDNELRRGRYLGLQQPARQPRAVETTRGQNGGPGRNLWGALVGRTSNYASSYFSNDQYRLNSWGVQAGYSFVSRNWLSIGVLVGAEAPDLRNSYDKIFCSEGYAGIYYGQRIWGMWELKGFLGGGLQTYTSHRNDTVYTYNAGYHGDSFETNIELSRPFLLRNCWMLRPYAAFDLEYASQAGTTETGGTTGNRVYSGASLTQLFLRIGMDFEKQYDKGSLLFGISYANMIGGQSVPNVYVFYPSVQKGVECYGADMGHNVVSFRFGGNRYLNAAKTRSVFADYVADVFCDRDGGASQHNFSIGFSHRF